MENAFETRQREENAMTDVRIQIPAGFTAATEAPAFATWADRFEVLYVPHESASHFESGVAKYDRERKNPAYRWKTLEGDNVGDSGRTVLAWRRQQDEMKIVRLAPEPAVATPELDGNGYEQAIVLLAQEHLTLDLNGSEEARPAGIGLVATLFKVSEEQVVDDYKRVAKELYYADSH
jgi:hypothetical protein